MVVESTFQSRWLEIEAPTFGAGPTFDAQRINQHLEGRANGQRIMRDQDVEMLLKDPFATLLLRQGVLPTNLTEILEALDKHDGSPDGLPQTSSFIISEGGQIRFKPGIKKGGVRLLTVRSRGGEPELMISTLAAQGMSPRSPNGLIEVIAWDPVNKTFHFYQRQKGAWFWCGQSDFAFDVDMRGEGPFDSHINGYPNMKELKAPWVHWDGPDLAIAATAFAPDDPLVSDPLFTGLEPGGAFIFETQVIRPLMERWNEARFAKAIDGAGDIGSLVSALRQVIGSTSFNLRTTKVKFSELGQNDVNDLPGTFFVDLDGLVDKEFGLGLKGVTVPSLSMAGARYAALISQFGLRVRGNRNGVDIDMPGDVPFCFAVPERAFEDTLALHGLLTSSQLSRRLAACLLMVDFPNPLDSPARASLLRHVPADARLTAATTIDDVLLPLLLDAANASPQGSPERVFKEHWDLGPKGWEEEFPTRIGTYLGNVATRLATDDGSEEIFRLAESRRRAIRRLPLLEFDLTLPVAMGIPDGAPTLEMTKDARVRARA